jgi:hypothetical protein
MGRLAAFEWLRSHKPRLLHGLLFGCLWLALLDFPRLVAAQRIDESWNRCLGHFVSNRSQCGVDYVWTYGPLGYFVHPVYVADLFWWKEARLDDLDSMPKLLSVHIEDSLWGRLRKALFRAPRLFLPVQTVDGQTYDYRLITGMAGSDFLLDPLIGDHKDIEALYAGQPLPRVRSFSIHADADARTCYQEQLQITVRGIKGLKGIDAAQKR